MERIATSILNRSKNTHYWFIVLYGAISFLPFIGAVHLFDWDEINFAEIAREMYTTGEYFKVQIGFESFYEKPPLFAWIQNLSYHLWGVNEFSARFPNSIFGIFSLLLLYRIGYEVKGRKFALVWVFIYSSTFLPFFFFKSGIIDPVFNFFIFSSIYLMIKGIRNYKKPNWFLLVGVINGLGILTKGPVALLIFLLTYLLYSLYYKRRFFLVNVKSILCFLIGVLLMVLVWFLPETILRGPVFIQEFVSYMIGLLTDNVAGHAQPFYYHFLVVLFGCFPASFIAIPELFRIKRHENRFELDFDRWMICLFWVVLILFSLVRTKIVNYSSMTYFPLTFLATTMLFKEGGLLLWQRKLIYVFGGLLGLILLISPFVFTRLADYIIPFIKDDAAVFIINNLDVPVLLSFIGMIYLLGIFFALKYWRKGVFKGAMVYAFCTIISLNLSLRFVMPKVEDLVQGGAISFYKRASTNGALITTLGFKSYGKLFYGQRSKSKSGLSNAEILKNKLPYEVYFVLKKSAKNNYKAELGKLKFEEEKNGFLLYSKTN